MKFSDIHPSKSVRGLLLTLVVLLAAFSLFGLGMAAGYEKARFSGKLGDHFERTFIGSADVPGMFAMRTRSLEGSFGGGPRFVERLPGGHGAVGRIVTAEPPIFVVAGPDNLEKTVVLSKDTLVRRFRSPAQASDLTIGEFVVVLGEPDAEGRVAAKLVRIVPPPPDAQ